LDFELDIEKIGEHFSEGQIKGFMVDLDMTYLEAILYLWFFNYVSITNQDRNKDCGRAMYIKFAKAITEITKENN